MTARTRGADDLVDAVLTASRVLIAVSARSLAEVEDSVTVVQFRTLVVLRTRGATNLTGIAEALAVNSSSALRMVDKLVAAGLVTRSDNPQNRREVQVTLTPQGAGLVDQVTLRRRAEIARIVRRVPPPEREQLAIVLHAFADAAGEQPVTGGATAYGW